MKRCHLLQCVLVLFYSANAFAQSEENITINAGLSGTWFNPESTSQGFQFDIHAPTNLFFGGWFTYDIEPTSLRSIGSEQQLWFSFQGTYKGTEANIPLFITRDGLFQSDTETTTEQVGQITFQFSSCINGSVSYQLNLDGVESSGEFAIERLTPDVFCNAAIASS